MSTFANRSRVWSMERKRALWLRQPTTSLASEIVTESIGKKEAFF